MEDKLKRETTSLRYKLEGIKQLFISNVCANGPAWLCVAG